MAVGITLTTTLENLQLELGVRKCPLLYDYITWSGLATGSCWTKSLCEKVGKLRIDVDMIYESIPLPRERDICIMEHFVELGIRGEQLAKLNKCRTKQ